MLIFIRDTFMYLHHIAFKMDLDCAMWLHQQACHVQDCYID
jgi:hypothetical protein